jgi:hypothetical protein
MTFGRLLPLLFFLAAAAAPTAASAQSTDPAPAATQNPDVREINLSMLRGEPREGELGYPEYVLSYRLPDGRTFAAGMVAEVPGAYGSDPNTFSARHERKDIQGFRGPPDKKDKDLQG